MNRWSLHRAGLTLRSKPTDCRRSDSKVWFDRGGDGFMVGLMEHSPGFLKLVNEVRPRIKEITIEQARERLKKNPNSILLDVREDDEWRKGHALEAVHLGKGVLERDLEQRIPDTNAEIIMYCGGGYRSALTADVAQRMGYQNVSSLIGGYKGMVEANWPMGKEE